MDSRLTLLLMEIFRAVKAWVAARVLNTLFVKAPPVVLTPEKEHLFEQMLCKAIERGPASDIEYACPHPKHEFLQYVVTRHPVLLHGANAFDLSVLEPQMQTNYNGKRTKAVFASGDGIWPIFFAVFNRRHYRGSIRNGCFVLTRPRRTEQRYYFFSVNAATPSSRLWTEGVVYILLRAPFVQTSQGVVRFDEWASPKRVYPLARLKVSPQDFPLLGDVSRHREEETMTTTWFSYRRRIRRRDTGARVGADHVI